MLRDILSYIQRQPRELRDYYALMGAVVLTGCIALIWASYIATFPNATSYTAALSSQPSVATKEDTVARSAPFSGFWGQMKEQITAWREVDEDMQAMPANIKLEPGSATNTAATSSVNNITITHEPTMVATSSSTTTSTTAASGSPMQP